MKVKNVSDKVKNFKINGEWQSVEPGKYVEAPMDIVSNEPGLELCKKQGKKDSKNIETKKLKEYKKLLSEGLSDFEARGTVWPEDNPLDLDGDGDVDKDDGSIAGKVMARLRHRKNKKK